jgi:hypothetical protein
MCGKKNKLIKIKCLFDKTFNQKREKICFLKKTPAELDAEVDASQNNPLDK